MSPLFSAVHEGGAGEPLVCLHGFTDTWRTWDLVIPALERRHRVLAPTLAGHAGGPPLDPSNSESSLIAGVEAAMEAADIGTAHIAGNSLGGYVAMKLAERGRARSVVALAPAGGWALSDLSSHHELLDRFTDSREKLKVAAPHAGALLSSDEGRRKATAQITVAYEHIPVELIEHLMLGAAACPAAAVMIDSARHGDWSIDPEAIRCPVRVVWGLADRLLPWPSAAERYRNEWLPWADWVELPDVGHCPQLDVPAVAAELIGGFAASAA